MTIEEIKNATDSYRIELHEILFSEIQKIGLFRKVIFALIYRFTKPSEKRNIYLRKLVPYLQTRSFLAKLF